MDTVSSERPLASLTILPILSTVVPLVLYPFLHRKWSAHALCVSSFTASVFFYIWNEFICGFGGTVGGCDVCIPKPWWLSTPTSVSFYTSSVCVRMGQKRLEELDNSNTLRQEFRVAAYIALIGLWVWLFSVLFHIAWLLGMDNDPSMYNIALALILGTAFITALAATYSPLLEGTDTFIYQFMMHHVQWSRPFDFMVHHGRTWLPQKLVGRRGRWTPMVMSNGHVEDSELEGRDNSQIGQRRCFLQEGSACRDEGNLTSRVEQQDGRGLALAVFVGLFVPTLVTFSVLHANEVCGF